MIKFSNYNLIKEEMEKKLDQREYDDILKQLGVMDEKGNLYLLHMNNKINDFLSKEDNKKTFLKEMGDIDIKGEKVKIKAKKLKPSQSSIYLDQVIKTISENPKFVKNVIRKGVVSRTYRNVSDDFLISSDNYIIDGHHRWCAAFILNPKCKIKCTKINLPIDVALPILNAIIKEESDSRNQDQSGNSNYNVFKLAYNENLPKTLESLIENDLNETEKTELFSKIKEIDKDGNPILYLSKNIQKLPKPSDDEFVERKDMPQLKHELEKIIDEF